MTNRKPLPTIIAQDIHGNKYKVSVNQLSFRPSVYGVILKNDKVLLSRQWDGYDFPGGGVHIGETIEQALVREVKEETGLDIKTGHLISIFDSFFKLPVSRKFVHSILIYCLCYIVKGKLTSKFSTAEEKSYIGPPQLVPFDQIKSGRIKFYNQSDNVAIIIKASKMAKEIDVAKEDLRQRTVKALVAANKIAGKISFDKETRNFFRGKKEIEYMKQLGNW